MTTYEFLNTSKINLSFELTEDQKKFINDHMVSLISGIETDFDAEELADYSENFFEFEEWEELCMEIGWC